MHLGVGRGIGVVDDIEGRQGCPVCECSVVGPGRGRRVCLGNFPRGSLLPCLGG